MQDLESLTAAFVDDGIYANATFLEEVDFVNGVRATTQVLRKTFFRPNILLLSLRQGSDLESLQALVDKQPPTAWASCSCTFTPSTAWGANR